MSILQEIINEKQAKEGIKTINPMSEMTAIDWLDDIESVLVEKKIAYYIMPSIGRCLEDNALIIMRCYTFSSYLERLATIEDKSPTSSDPILRELVEETIAKSHREWRSIPETAVLVLKAIEDYGVGK